MSKNTVVTLFKGGTLERKAAIKDIKVPDLWHVAEALRKNGKVFNGPACAMMILELWHIAHSLHQHIVEAKS